MEVSKAEFDRLQKLLQTNLAYVEMIRKYHLGTRPSFMFRNHWNEINDGLAQIKINCLAAITAANAIAVARPDSDIRET